MKKTLLALALTAGLTSFAGTAKAGLSFDWSFSGTDSHPGNVSGVLTLNDAGTAATSIYVTKSTNVPFDPNFNMINPSSTLVSNQFQVINGQIVNASYGSVYQNVSETDLALNYSGAFNDFYYWTGRGDFQYETFNSDGFSGVSFTAAVPEPSQVAASLLLVAGIAGFVIVKRRQETSELEVLAA